MSSKMYIIKFQALLMPDKERHVSLSSSERLLTYIAKTDFRYLLQLHHHCISVQYYEECKKQVDL